MDEHRRGTALTDGAEAGASSAGLALAWLEWSSPGVVDALLPALGVVGGAALTGALVGWVAARVRLSPAATTLALAGAGATTLGFLRHVPYASLSTTGLVAIVSLALVYVLACIFGARTHGSSGRGRSLGRMVLVLVVVAAFVASDRRAFPGDAMDQDQVVVVGLDGGTFNVLQDLIERGAVPNFERMQREGAAAELLSLEITSSPRVWTSIATGRPPAGHGIAGFGELQNEHLRAPRIWDQVARSGRPVLVYEWLVTWPPDRAPPGSFVVPGWMARSTATWPASLSYVKEAEVAYQKGVGLPLTTLASFGLRSLLDGVRLSTFLGVAVETLQVRLGPRRSDAEYAYARNKLLQQRTNADTFLRLLRLGRFPFASITFYGSDALSHKYWKYRDAGRYDVAPDRVALFAGVIDEYYRGVDAFLGRLLERVGPRTSVWVVSDHGFTGATPGAFQSRYTIKTEAFLGALGVPGASAFVITNTVVLQPPEGEAPERVGAAAGEFVLVRTGAPLFRWSVEEQGVRAKIDPELARSGAFDLLQEDVRLPSGEVVRADRILSADRRSGIHQREGIVFAWGDGIAASGRREQVGVLDLMPTWLRLLDLGGGQALPGRVLADWLTRERRARLEGVLAEERRRLDAGERLPTIDEGYLEWRREVEWDAVETTDASDRLRDLGYVGDD